MTSLGFRKTLHGPFWGLTNPSFRDMMDVTGHGNGQGSGHIDE